MFIYYIWFTHCRPIHARAITVLPSVMWPLQECRPIHYRTQFSKSLNNITYGNWN